MNEIQEYKFGGWVRAARCQKCNDGFESNWATEWVTLTPEEKRTKGTLCRNCGAISSWTKSVGKKIKKLKFSWKFPFVLVESMWLWRNSD